MSTCTAGESSPNSFRGISIDTFREISLDAKRWEEGVDYSFLCLEAGTDEAVEYVLSEDGVCDGLIAATTITKDRTSKGVIWAYPYLSSNLAVIVQSNPSSNNGWNWTLPFTWQLWLATGVTILILPLMVSACELFVYQRHTSTSEYLKGYKEALYMSMVLFITMGTPQLTAFPTRIIVIFASFTALILTASYTANLAAFLTLRNHGNINSIYDLNGLAVSTAPIYSSRLFDRYGLVSSSIELASISDAEKQADLVAKGNLAAFIIDQEIAKYLVGNYPDCKLRILPTGYEPYEYGLAFDPRTENSTADDFTISILSLTERGEIQSIVDKYTQDESECFDEVSQDGELARISFMQVYGLWILMASACGVALVQVLIVRQFKHRTSWKQQTNGGSVPELLAQESDLHIRS